MHVTMPELEIFSRAEAARRLGLSAATLKRYATTGQGPTYMRTGDRKGRVMYSAADLAAWLRSRRVVNKQSDRPADTGNPGPL